MFSCPLLARTAFVVLLACQPLAAATFTVTNTNDSGPGSLRQAIMDAGVVNELIVFNIPGTGVKKIAPLTPLPSFASAGGIKVIDGTTQPGWSVGNPVIELSGENMSGTSSIGLYVVFNGGSAQVTFRGLIINRFEGAGIQLQDSENVTIEGCFIGTDATGTIARPNRTGIYARSVGVNLENVVIGGNTPAQRNVISGNTSRGIEIFLATNCFVRGNYIGTDKTGQFAIPNGTGVQMFCANAVIGGPTAAEGNVLSGNTGVGLAVDSMNNLVQNNFIGVAADGFSALGNRRGIYLNNSIGLSNPGNHHLTGNVVAFNTIDGIGLFPTSKPTVGNRILGNSIHSNGQLGINLDYDDGVTANDPGDVDTGTNNLQNFPVLTSAVSNAAGTVILGTLNSQASTSYRIEFFSNAVDTHQGRTFLGFQNVTTNAAGDATINASVAGICYFGEFVTATATRNVAPLDTSEFSAAVPAVVTQLTVTNTNNSGTGSLRQAILDANSSSDPNEIVFAIPPLNSTVKTISPTSALPTITQPVAINGFSQAPGSGSGLKIELNGTSAGGSTSGLTVTADRVVIQGLVINRFGNHGIHLNGCDLAVVQSNRIGTHANGGSVLANGGNGILLSNAANNRILSNLLSGNTGAGLRLNSSSNNTIQTNIVGVDPRQGGALSNAGGGILLMFASSNNLVGGSAAGEGNVLGANAVAGLLLSGSGATNNRIYGNAIGTDSAGTATDLGNFLGVQLDSAAANNSIGGFVAGQGNIIAENSSQGVVLLGTAGSGNRIVGNTIRGNRDAGIDLNDDGVTANDTGDADTGPNGLQNFPVLTAAESYFAGLTVTGSLNSRPNETYRIELFANASCDGTHGEGQTLLGSVETATGSGGNGTFQVTIPTTVAVGQFVTATATRLSTGDTSEFSACRTVTVLSIPTLTVTNVNDSGAGSLRQVLTDANATTNPKQIAFNIPGGGVHTIVATTSLPRLTTAVVIDGLTQPGATASALLIELDGQNNANSGHGLQFSASGTVRGLAIGRFRGDGLRFDTLGNNIVQNCRIGTDATGLLDRGNARNGIYFEFVGNNIVGGTNGEGNLVSSNTRLSVNFGGELGDSNIRFFNSNNNLVQGNIVGPNLAGAALTSTRRGISVLGDNNVIGGPTAAERNVVNSALRGISVENGSNNLVQGNYVGVDSAGEASAALLISDYAIRIQDGPDNRVVGNVASNTRSPANGGAGISVTGANSSGTVITGNRIGTNAAGTADAGNVVGVLVQFGADVTIGGATAAERNIISGNDNQGIFLTNGTSSGNPPTARILGNYIGLGADGSTVLPNAIGFETFNNAPNIQIGGSAPGATNVISGNTTIGLSLASSGNLVQRNFIGTDATGTLARPNSTGILLRSGASGNTIGGTSAALGNLISGNLNLAIDTLPGATGADANVVRFNLIGTTANGLGPLPNFRGIRLESSGNTISQNTVAFGNGTPAVAILPPGTGNRLSQNSIHSNAGLGIDLGQDGVTPNDGTDADTGANLRQNFPVLTNAAFFVRGNFQGAANAALTLQFFMGSPGTNQGRIYLGEQSVTTNGSGFVNFNFSPTQVTVPLPFNQTVTATATDAAGNTSEFSAAIAVSPTYEAWAIANGIPGALREEDSDLDGIPNSVEYSIGSNPTAFTVLPGLVVLGNGDRQFTVPKGVEARLDPAMAYRFQTSLDLQTWSAQLNPTSETATEAVFVLPAGPAKQFVRFVSVSQ